MKPPPFSLPSLPFNDRVLVVDFVWEIDRYVHHIHEKTLDDPNLNPCVQVGIHSVHDDLESLWPKCPAIQQLHLESSSHGDVLLGVGLAGTNHYSVSVETRAPGVLRFDWAVRTRGSVDYVGTQYDLSVGSSECPDTTMHPAELKALRTSVQLACQAEGGCEFVQEPGKWILNYAGTRSDKPSTLQWAYQIRIVVSDKHQS